MGGLGSGRPNGSARSSVESCRAIDVHRLFREGCLKSGWTGGWQWMRDGEEVASLRLRTEGDALRLTYRVRVSEGDWTDVDETVRIVRVPCRFGGSRPYLVCPGVVNGRVCNRHVVKLYGAGRYFLCRDCYRLTYTSRNETALDRTRRQGNKIRRRLGGDSGLLSPFPGKPKGMWQRTYNRLRAKAIGAEVEADRLFEVQAKRFLVRFHQGHDKRSFWS